MRTLGDRPGVEKAFQGAIDRGEAVGPRLKVCVRALRPSHGTAPFLCFPADGEEELTLKIRENFSQGADWIEVVYYQCGGRAIRLKTIFGAI